MSRTLLTEVLTYLLHIMFGRIQNVRLYLTSEYHLEMSGMCCCLIYTPVY